MAAKPSKSLESKAFMLSSVVRVQRVQQVKRKKALFRPGTGEPAIARFESHPYQEYAIRRIIEEPAVGLLLDMGLGKTVITLTALEELMYDRFEVRRALVIAPKKVAEATWQAEAAKWDHLKDLRFSTVLGTEKQRLAALEAAEAERQVAERQDRRVWKLSPRELAIIDRLDSAREKTNSQQS